MLGNLNRLKFKVSPGVGTYVSEAQSLQTPPAHPSSRQLPFPQPLTQLGSLPGARQG